MGKRPLVTDIPADHRTDWREAAIRALRAALDRVDPSGVEASVRKRRDCLEVGISGRSEAERLEITFWEDEATVRANGETHKFENSSEPRRWRPDPGHNWIPELVEFVERRISHWST